MFVAPLSGYDTCMIPQRSTGNDTIYEAARQHYERDGFCVAPPLISADLIKQVPEHMDAVLTGQFETGIAPMWTPKENETRVRVIDQAHVADHTLYQLVSDAAIGDFAAAITGARKIQVWAVSLIYKPVGGDKRGGIGWHQDLQYWQTMWEPESELLTAWVAVSDVTEASGPLRFVPGSHRWGLLHQGDFGTPDHAPVTPPEGAVWQEVPALLSPGAVSFHHSLTYHGSGTNVSSVPRLGFALHLCTEKSQPRPLDNNPGAAYLSHLNDYSVCPLLFSA